MGTFESLGENCEFGLVQRRCGAEPLGLLRFSSAPLPKLVKALDARFSGMGMPAAITVKVSPNGSEYMVLDGCFGFEYHAWVLVEEKSPEAVHQRECRRVPFLVRKLIEDLTGGEKIFVYHGMVPLHVDDAFRLLASMQQYGPATLMWVELADEDAPAGTVEWLVPGLLKAHVDRFAPGDNAHDFSLDVWIDICRKAYTMAREGFLPARASTVDMRPKTRYMGYVDEANRSCVIGWVANEADWNQSLLVEILVNGVSAAMCEANQYRAGLEKIHPDATGRYEFKFDFAEPLTESNDPKIEVRVARSDYYLRASS